jgi:hypothetical protein
MENVGKLYGHFVYFSTIWYFYGRLAYIVVILVNISRFWYVVP